MEDLKQKLQMEFTQVTDELEAIATLNVNTGDWEASFAHGGEADSNLSADNSEEGIERQGLVASLETRWRNLQTAIKKMEAGTFGKCEICQGDIEPARLEANPASRTCVADKDKEADLPL